MKRVKVAVMVLAIALVAVAIALPSINAQEIEETKAQMPFIVYDDDGGMMPYIPSGYMGNFEAISQDMAWAENPQSGTTCIKAVYSAPRKWGGVVWQDPANDWGEEPGGYNLADAKNLVFWARGEDGGEKVKFEFGVLKYKTFSDSAHGGLGTAVLSKEWTKYTIPLEGKNLSCIKTGFVWTVVGAKKPIIFYIDGIQFE